MRLDSVEEHLRGLRRSLEARADGLARTAAERGAPELGGADPGRVGLAYAQAQAVAELAQRTSLIEILLQGRVSASVSLVASMALGRWLAALHALGSEPVSDAVILRHIRAGRLAHRTLRNLKPRSGMRRYCGLLTSSVVVAEFVHPDNQACVEHHIEAGIARARRRPGRSDEMIQAAVSAALRTGARLVEDMAMRAEPVAKKIAASAETIESDVEARLRSQMF